MAALLLDTHVLLWYFSQGSLSADSLIAIAESQADSQLYVSTISAWELGVAQLKTNPAKRPDLRGLPAAVWFQRAVRNIGAKAIQLEWDLVMEAAGVPPIYGSGDPGDCFLIATAHKRKLTLLTRDRNILRLSEQSPKYLKTVAC